MLRSVAHGASVTTACIVDISWAPRNNPPCDGDDHRHTASLVGLMADTQSGEDPGGAVDDRDSRTYNDVSDTVNTLSGDSSGVTIQTRDIKGSVHVATGRVAPWFGWTIIVILSFVLVLVFVIAVNPRPSTAGQAVPRVPAAPTPTSATVNGPLAVNSEWPALRGCPSDPSVVMPAGKAEITAFPADPSDTRQQMVAAGAAAWQQGTLYLNLSVPEGQPPIELLNIVPHIDPPSHVPASWGYESLIGCGPDFNERRFSLNLDKRDLHDEGLTVDVPDSSLKLAPSEPLGPTLKIASDQPKTIRFDVTGCRANYTWYLDVDYAVVGKEHQYVRTLGPYRTFSLLASTAPVYAINSPDGGTYSFTREDSTADLTQQQCGQQ